MRESDLYVPVRDWLVARGYAVHIEVFDADVIGINESGHMVVVELKLQICKRLIHQLHVRCGWADEVYAAIPKSSARPPSDWSYWGWGLLVVDGSKVATKRMAKPQPYLRNKTRLYRQRVLAKRNPAADHHVAGLPSCALAKMQRSESIREPVPSDPERR
jgi:hypothetical protein